ncbi:HipA N-terminal domain-containing protein [Nocardioides sp. LHD-245]|uniref:HipA N-terminal domain-containing protein n=1 Tax=Nocardioides sp. LHD-245 TaxID=3051387 RepID=UPI00370938B1
MSERLTVLLYGQLVGHLERTGSDDPDFTYTAEYAASGRAPLSSRLPITPQGYRADRVLPYLHGLLPRISRPASDGQPASTSRPTTPSAS